MSFDTLGSEGPVVPVLVRADELAVLFWRGLWEEGIFSTPALPPGVPAGRSLIRTSANHAPEHIERLLEAFAVVGKRLGVIG